MSQDIFYRQMPGMEAQMDEREKFLIDLLESKIDAFAPFNMAKHIEIKANIAYLMGFQDIQEVNGQIVPLPVPYACKVTSNKILPAVQNDIAVSTKVPPIFDIVPAGTDQDDRATAIVSEKLFQYIKRKNGGNLARDAAVLWYDISGVGWRKVYWNSRAEVLGINPPQYDKYGMPNPDHVPGLPEGAPITEGEVMIDVVPTTDLIYDNRVKDLTKLDWIIHAKPVTLRWIADTFGKEFAMSIKGSRPSDNFARNGFESRFLVDFQQFSQMHTSHPTNMDDSKIKDADKVYDYYEMWHRPTSSMPTGMYVVMIGGRIAYDGPYPVDIYPHKKLPFIPANPIPLKGIAPGSISRVTQARPLQREYNEIRSLILDNTSAMGNARILVPRGCELDYKRITNTPASYIEYSGSRAPRFESGNPLPNSLFQHLLEIRRDLNEIFAFHEPSKGQMPTGGPKSAKGLGMLQNADYTQLGPIINNFEQAEEEIVYQAVTLGITNYKNKLINIVGDDHQWTVNQIDAEQLNGRINVIVKLSSSLPIDKENEAIKAFGVWQSGLLGDPNDPELKMYTIQQMQLGNADNILQRYTKQQNFAMKEFVNALETAKAIPPVDSTLSEAELEAYIKQNVFVPDINMFDDDSVHIFYHNQFLMDNYYKLLATGNAVHRYLIRLLQQHIVAHQLRLQSVQEQQFQRQLMSEAFVKGNTMDQLLLKKLNFDSDDRQSGQENNKDKGE